MLTDPTSVTINGSAVSLARVSVGANTATYANADGTVQMVTKQGTTKSRFRREARLIKNKIAENPLTATNEQIGVSVYLVIDEPRAGFTDTEIEQLVEGLKDFLTLSNQGKLLGGEY